jgi:hypothetical protein
MRQQFGLFGLGENCNFGRRPLDVTVMPKLFPVWILVRMICVVRICLRDCARYRD